VLADGYCCAILNLEDALQSEWLVQPAQGITTTCLQSADELVSTAARELYEWWRKDWPARPTRRDFDVVDFAPFARSIYLTKRTRTGYFAVRVQGESVLALIGNDSFPREFSVDDPEPFGVIASNYENAIMQFVPLLHKGQLELFDREYATIEGLDLPLAANNGQSAYILGTIHRTDR